MSEKKLYVIRFYNKKGYIFESTINHVNVVPYLEEHGNQWVQMNRPIILVTRIYTTIDDINRITIKHMKYLGIDNVRGGSFSNPTLTRKQRLEIKYKILLSKGIIGRIRAYFYKQKKKI